jgi:hypothetical protein
MLRSPLFRTSLALLAAVAMPSARAGAQGLNPRGPFMGLGVGIGSINDAEASQHRVGPVLHGRVGWGFSRTVAAMVELGVHGLGDDQPRTSDLTVVNSAGATAWNRRPEVLNTVSLLASVQVGDPEQVYVRPGIGLGRHAFATYEVGPTTVTRAQTSHEAGPAAGLALGRVFNVSQRFPMAVEGLLLWSHGEDSAGSRWAAGVQVVPQLHF